MNESACMRAFDALGVPAPRGVPGRAAPRRRRVEFVSELTLVPRNQRGFTSVSTLTNYDLLRGGPSPAPAGGDPGRFLGIDDFSQKSGNLRANVTVGPACWRKVAGPGGRSKRWARRGGR
jgi:hypothetical protein